MFAVRGATKSAWSATPARKKRFRTAVAPHKWGTLRNLEASRPLSVSPNSGGENKEEELFHGVGGQNFEVDTTDVRTL